MFLGTTFGLIFANCQDYVWIRFLIGFYFLGKVKGDAYQQNNLFYLLTGKLTAESMYTVSKAA